MFTYLKACVILYTVEILLRNLQLKGGRQMAINYLEQSVPNGHFVLPNDVRLAGVVTKNTVNVFFEAKGKIFRRLTLAVERLSGKIDFIPLIIPSALAEVQPGDYLEVSGNICSYNEVDEKQISHRKIYVFVKSVAKKFVMDENQVLLAGYLCDRGPVRKIETGKEMCHVTLKVPVPNKLPWYIPCVIWGWYAQMVQMVPLGTECRVEGRLENHFHYQALSEEEGDITWNEVLEVSAYQISLG